MRSEWRRFSWGDIATLEYGKALRGYRDGEGLVPVYGTNGRIGFTNEPLCGNPGVIIGRKGAYRGVHYSATPFFAIDTAFYLKPMNLEILDVKWAYYKLLTVDINSMDSGSAIPSTSRQDFYALPVDLPSLWEQELIADTLSCLDTKIELNNRINENLEAQAQAIFKSWFADFEPFQEGEFVESELGLIPKGWRIGKVDDIVELHDSKRVPLSSREREGMDKIYPYYGAASLMDYVEDYIFDGINLLLGEDGTVIDNDGHPILQYVYGRFWVNNHAHVISSRSAYTVEHLYILFSTLNVRSAVTGAVQKKINQRNLKSIPIILPPQEIVTKYNTVIEPFFSQRRKLERENKVLSALRDTLLPKLMSGEIEVPID